MNQKQINYHIFYLQGSVHWQTHKKRKDSNLIFELFFFLLIFWFMGPAMLQVKEVKK